MLEEIEFHRLAKLRMEVDEPEDLYVPSGFLLSTLSHFNQRDIRPRISVRQDL